MSGPPSWGRTDVEFVVVGAGLLGLSTAWHLVRRGREVLVLEGVRVGHAGGGSRGSCRIFRLGYDDPRYVEMAKQALPLWRDLEADTGMAVLTTTGQLTFGRGLDALGAALSAAGAEFDRWSATEVVRHFPEVAAPGPALFEPASGVIHAERSLELLRLSVDPSLREGVAVVGLQDHGYGVSVETAVRTVKASVVVCCAGPESASLLATAGIHLNLWASLEQVAYFAPRRGGSRRLPIIIEREEPMLYGLPTPDGGLFKTGRHHASPPVAVEGAALTPDPAEDARLAAAVRRFLPGLGSPPVSSERCFYDNSPDENFILDRVGRIVIGAGTSGHGFKFGPLLGEVLADLAEGHQPRVPIDWLAASRAGLAPA